MEEQQPYTPAGAVIEVQWHGPDRKFHACFLRDGQPWTLGGGAVGSGYTRGEAVGALVAIARYLVTHGENFLLTDRLTLEDRQWLFALVEDGPDAPEAPNYGEMRAALARAERTPAE
jgi:hypothetical protein